VIELSPPSYGEASIDQATPPGRRRDAHHHVVPSPERGTVTAYNEWPTIDVAVRVLAAAGISTPAPSASTRSPTPTAASVSGTGHDDRVDATFEQFVTLCQGALGHLVEGRPDPFKALSSHADDVVIMGAFGGHERGWEKVSAARPSRRRRSRIRSGH
jgi:hypothetical protein